MKKENNKTDQLVTIEECGNCHIRYKRAFKEGDFIGKPGRTCEFCGGQMYIVLIYKEEAKRTG